MNLYDAHNHYHDAWLAPHRAQVFADLTAIGLRAAVVNGTCESDWIDVEELARISPVVRPSYGLHPWDAGNRTRDWQQKLLTTLDRNPHAAVGEIGLDRWILDRARPDDPRLAGLRRAPLDEQLEVFLWQLALATERDLPVSIHCLDAHGPMLEALRRVRLPRRGFLLHAYSGSAEMVQAFAELGAFFSFNGSFLDPRKARVQEIYAALPVDRLLVETDAPAMRLPAPFERFSLPATPDCQLPNHPANLAVTYERLAALRKTSVALLAASVEANFSGFFGDQPTRA